MIYSFGINTDLRMNPKPIPYPDLELIRIKATDIIYRSDY